MRCLGTSACKERCMNACKKSAIELGGTREDALDGTQLQLVHIKRELCDNCGDCADKCYAGALTMCGKDYTAGELVERLLQDKSFFENSGGGVTISGGEALCQIDFVVAVLRGLKESGIHTALDTTGFAPWETVERTVPWTDLYLYDVKHTDSEKHRAATGVPNELIIANLKKLASIGKSIQIRIPIIPRFNDDEENLIRTADMCRSLGSSVTMVQLLPYHNLGVMKYLRLGDITPIEAIPPSDEKMKQIKELMEGFGLHVSIH